MKTEDLASVFLGLTPTPGREWSRRLKSVDLCLALLTLTSPFLFMNKGLLRLAATFTFEYASKMLFIKWVIYRLSLMLPGRIWRWNPSQRQTIFLQFVASYFVADLFNFMMNSNQTTKRLLEISKIGFIPRYQTWMVRGEEVTNFFIQLLCMDLANMSGSSEHQHRMRNFVQVRMRNLSSFISLTKANIWKGIDDIVLVLRKTKSGLEEGLAFHFHHPEGYIRRTLELFQNPEYVSCEVCLSEISTKRAPGLDCCEKHVCIRCLRQYMETSAADPLGSPFGCPIDASCPSLSPSSKVIAYSLSASPYRRKNQKLLQQINRARFRYGILTMHDFMQCPSPDCQNIVFADDDMFIEETYLIPDQLRRNTREKVSTTWVKTTQDQYEKKEKIEIETIEAKMFKEVEAVDLRKFKCSSCGYSSCVVCKKMWTFGVLDHSQISCQSFKQLVKEQAATDEERLTDEKLEELKSKGVVKPCPSCEEMIEKNGGCSHMICYKCRKDFCWKCETTYPCNC
eukprot:maker-scaffold_77-snap-gene-0.5-mRNA-1 protein AED:0.00 eAED:0.00 QI:110/1/1/1/0/0/2/239/510